MDIAFEKNKNLQKPILNMTENLEDFLQNWDQEYETGLYGIDLFNSSLTCNWSNKQKEYFVKLLYHARGHFHDVLWYMGNFAPDSKSKKIILQNIEDEFSLSGISHELLYLMFSNSLGVNLENEAITEENYLPFLKEFNKGHLIWLREHDWENRLAFFAALERLDNIDYIRGKKIAESLGVQKKDLTFFNVHINVEHFSPTLDLLLKIWGHNPEKIKEGFDFIRYHQTTMWKKMSDTVFELT